MRKQKLDLQGFAYQQGEHVEVYLKLPNGKFVKCVGDAKQAQRNFGRDTRPPAPSRYNLSA